ncbi:MAG: molybdopterin-guanine dinucleotide biosynthesis protein [Jatrophihabitans sp.]|nr:MAG: molybdopterin-guanine dinucleotide biosynthesis protein [Jatrophihabitans sp.]
MGLATSDWLTRFAAELGIEPPGPQEVQELLALAGVAAHAAERTAAPLSCWLAARAGVGPAEGLRVAERLAAALGSD